MKHGTQKIIATNSGLCRSYVSEILSGKKRVTKWDIAKRLTQAVPGTTPELWFEGAPEEIRTAIKNAGQTEQTEHPNEVAA